MQFKVVRVSDHRNALGLYQMLLVSDFATAYSVRATPVQVLPKDTVLVCEHEDPAAWLVSRRFSTVRSLPIPVAAARAVWGDQLRAAEAVPEPAAAPASPPPPAVPTQPVSLRRRRRVE